MVSNREKFGYKIACINRILARKADKKTLEYGITEEQGRMICYLYYRKDKDIYLKNIENDIHLRKSSLTSLLNNLEKKGYIKRIVQKNDLRLKKIELTKKGDNLFCSLEKAFKESDNEVLENISKDEEKEFNRLLDKILDNYEEN